MISLRYRSWLQLKSSKLIAKRYASTSSTLNDNAYGVAKTDNFLKGISENLSKIKRKESSKHRLSHPKESTEITQNEDLSNSEKSSKIKYFKSKDIQYDPIEPSNYLKENTVKVETPMLAHDLSRVLFQPNVYHQLQDVRSKVYNFTPFLQNIIKVEQFDFNKINLFIPSGKDQRLLGLVTAINDDLYHKLSENKRKIKESGKKRISKKKPNFIKFYSSTSSMTGILSQFHFALSNFKCPNYSKLSKEFHVKSKQFTQGSTMAAFVVLSKKKTSQNNDKKQHPVYSIDADKSTDSDQILSIMGNPLEKLLTTNETEFKKYFQRKQHNENVPSNEEIPESYHYAKVNKFLIRSQLDCYDPRLPNTGTFDLKTRAVCAIRADLDYIQDVKLNSNNYQIDKLFGKFESHEKEKFDLIRSAMLKYSFQARLGNMDGIFVCYHNLEKIFGFEYLPLTDIDEFYHYEEHNEENENSNNNNNQEEFSGLKSFDVTEKSVATERAEFEFKASFKILEDILQSVVAKYPEFDSLRFVFKAIRNKDTGNTDLYVMYVPLTPEEAQSIQGKQEELIIKEQKDECELIRGILDRNTEVEQKLNIDLRKHRKALQKERFKEISEITNSKVEGFKISFEHLKKTDSDEIVQYNIQELAQQEASRIYTSLLKEKAGISWRKAGSSENVDKYVETLRYLSEVVGKQKELNHQKHSANKVLWKSQIDE